MREKKARLNGRRREDRTQSIDKKEENLKAMRRNVRQLLANSTVMPFRWLSTCFRCFYCYEMFEMPEELKSHQAAHSNEDITKAIDNYYEETVFVDVAHITCKLCSDAIENIHQMADHLISQHGVDFDVNIGLCMMPFELDKKQCVICDTHLKYANMVTHMMKKHSRITAMYCALCKTRFRNTKQLCSHVRGEILNKTASCVKCHIDIDISHLGDHMKVVHGMRYRCLACWEHFRTHYQRSLHMAKIHKRRDLMKCLYCPRTFVFGSILRRHIRERHLKERNAICDVCGWKTFGQHELKAHMVKHATSKDHKCPYCEKMFKTKKNMSQHCIKTHQ